MIVWPIGDSWVVGAGPQPVDSFRRWTERRVTFVGTQTDEWGEHDGHGGSLLGYLVDQVRDAPPLSSTPEEAWVLAGVAHINQRIGIGQQQLVNEMVAYYHDIARELNMKYPGIRILIGTLPGYSQTQQWLKSQVCVRLAAALRVQVWDENVAIARVDDGWKDLFYQGDQNNHPSDEGDAHIAGVYLST